MRAVRTRVLIVDGHWVVIEGVKSALRVYSEIEVVGEAFNYNQALKQVRDLRPDIVIADISLPELKGIEATLQIERSVPKVSIIIFSMNSNEEHIIDLLRAGVSGYVLKESQLSELVLAVKAAKEGGTYLGTMASTALSRYLKHLKEVKCDGESLKSLSTRECEVLKLLAEGESIKGIASQLCISPKTVESHKYKMMSKLGLRTIAEVTKIAIKTKLIQL
jgi:DNA-binding NarL/FixJ family response regulator